MRENVCVLIIFSLTLFGIAKTFAQFGPVRQVATCDVCSPEDIEIADLDGDGDQDLISASSSNDRIAWYENDGFGNFSRQKIIADPIYLVNSIDVADIDGDGDLDIVSTNDVLFLGGERFDGNVNLYINDGNGNFSSPQRIQKDFAGETVIIRDIDGDQIPDILVASSSDVFWFRNDGATSFGSPRIITENEQRIKSLIAEDLDNDGDQDVAFASEEGIIAWHENTGQGDFLTRRSITQQVNLGQAALQYADLNNDGNKDIISVTSGDEKLALYAGDGNGNYSNQQIISTMLSRPTTIYPADLDGDGDLDIASSSSTQLVWLRNNGSGGFSAPIILFETPNTGGGKKIVVVEDLDDDGDGDIVFSDSSENDITIHKNEGDEIFSTPLYVTFGVASTSAINSADLDNDGDLDLLSTAFNSPGLAWYENDGQGNFKLLQVIDQTAGGTSVNVADFDGDGNQDVVATFRNDLIESKVMWYRNTGDGQFESPIAIGTQDAPAYSVHPVDFDNDGDLDIIFGNGNRGIGLYQNDGSGNFSEFVMPLYPTTFAIALADLNSDDKIDILYAGSDVGWFENLGSGNFMNHLLSTQGGGLIYATDINGDQLPDVLHNDFWLENLGDGQFAFPNSINNSLSSTHPADLDNDGDEDLIGVSDNNIVSLSNDGSGNFAAPLALTSDGIESGAFHAADLDGDGTRDIIGARINIRFAEEIIWIENNSVTNIQRHNTHSSFLNAYPLPASEHLYIELQQPTSSISVELYLTDLQGRVIWRQKQSSTDFPFKTDVSQLPTGVFLLFAKWGEEQTCIKILKK